MLRLNVLGGLSLFLGDEPHGGRAAQRRRSALLALVAMEGEQGISRARLGAYLWPEANEERSRHALAQLLYTTRRDLGADDLFVGQEVLRLNPARIAVDALELLAAADAGDHRRVVDLYRGPFLDGVHLGGTHEFEHWVDGHRERLARVADGALASLVADATARGDAREVLAWCQRRAQLAPFDSDAAAQLVDALSAVGDLAGAMQWAERFDDRMRSEMGHRPGPAFFASVRRLRERQEAHAAEVPPVEVAVARLPSPRAAEEGGPPREAPALPAPARTRFSTRARMAMVVAAVLVGAFIVASMAPRTKPAHGALRTSDEVTVLPFDVEGSGDIRFLRNGLVDLVSASLEETRVLHPTDPHLVIRTADAVTTATRAADVSGLVLQKLNPALFVRGSLVESAGRLRLTAALYRADAPSVPLATASAEGGRDELFAMVDRTALSLTAGRMGGMAARFEGLAAQSTPSVPALHAYVEGEAAFRMGKYGDAIAAFKRATLADTTFALAYFRLATAYEWADYPLAEREAAAAAAVRVGTRLPNHERALLEAVRLTHEAHYWRARAILRALVHDYPNDVAAWFQLAELEFHYQPSLGGSFLDSREPFERLAALAPEDPGAVLHLARLAAFDGRTAALDSLMRRYHVLRPEDRDPEAALLHLTAAGRTAERDSVIATLARADVGVVAGAAWRATQYALDPRTGMRTARQLLRADRAEVDRHAGYRVVAYAALAGGRWPEARDAIASLRRSDAVAANAHEAYLASIPGVPVPREELERIRDAVERSRRSAGCGHADSLFKGGVCVPGLYELYTAGLVSAKLHDQAGVERALGGLTALSVPANAADARDENVATLRAHALAIAGRPDSAMAALRAAITTLLEGRGWVEAPERSLMAELSLALGDTAQAERWYASFAGGFWGDLAYVPGAEAMLARLARARRDAAAAREHERRLALLVRR